MRYACGRCQEMTEADRLVHRTDFELDVCPKCSRDLDAAARMKQTAADLASAPPPVAKCPQCGSTSLTIKTRGFSAGKAAAGALLLGPVGLLFGSKGSNETIRVCLNCKHEF